VAIYISCSLNTQVAISPVLHGSSEMISIDVFSHEGLFRSPHRTLRMTLVYLLHSNHPPYGSIHPDSIFSPRPYLPLIVGDLNIHHPLADPVWSISDREYILVAAYFDAAFDKPYHLLNTPGVFTHFPFDTISRPSVLAMFFANSHLSPFISSWNTPLPSTASDYVPIVVILQALAIILPPLTPD